MIRHRVGSRAGVAWFMLKSGKERVNGRGDVPGPPQNIRPGIDLTWKKQKRSMIKHNKTQDLLLYWTRLKGDRPVPDREEISPRDIKILLPNLFMLEKVDPDHYIFRLAGTALCHHYGREFRDHNFLSLWPDHDRSPLRDMLSHVILSLQPALVHCRAHTLDQTSLNAELLFLPYSDKRSETTRILGIAHALSGTNGLAGRKLVGQHIIQMTALNCANDNGNVIPFARHQTAV